MTDLVTLRTMFANRLRKRDRHLARWAKRERLTCYRVYDGDIPEIPISVDRYAEFLLVTVYFRHEIDEAWVGAVRDAASEALEVPIERISVKARKRGVGGTLTAEPTGRDERIAVSEGDLRFWVNLWAHLDSGLFMDHRPTRRMVRELSAGKDVLNLFSYTGSFSVYAHAGGARSTTSVDMSKTYTAWTDDNFRLNRLDLTKSRVIVSDIIRWVGEEQRTANRYDLAIVDPPTYSRSRRMVSEWDVQRDHRWLLGQVLNLMKDDGVVFFSTNYRRFEFLAGDLADAEIEEITPRTIPEDFPYSRPHRCWRIEVRR